MADKKQSTVFGLLNNLASMINCTFRGRNTDVQSALGELENTVDWSPIRKKVGTFNGHNVFEQTCTLEPPTKNNFTPLNDISDATGIVGYEFVAEYNDGTTGTKAYYASATDFVRAEMWMYNNKAQFYYLEGQSERTMTKVTIKVQFTTD